MWAINVRRLLAGLLLTSAAGLTAGPEVDRLPQPLAQPSLDLEALARGYDATLTHKAMGTMQGPQLLVFISLGMPTASLERLFEQAARAQAVLVLRGLLNGSWRDTVQRLQPLVARHRVALQIDPQAFDRHGVTQVPTLVLVANAAGEPNCAPAGCPVARPDYQVAGDVSLDYALNAMQRIAPALNTDVELFRRRLQPSAP